MNEALKLTGKASVTAKVDEIEKLLMDAKNHVINDDPILAQRPKALTTEPKVSISWALKINDVDCHFTLWTPETPAIDCEARDALLKAERTFFEAVAKAMPVGGRVDLTLIRGEK